MPRETENHLGLLIVLCGPSGVGKSTICTRLSERMKVTYAASVTTRSQRPGDDRAKKYEYVADAEFFHRLDADEFLEYANVFGHYYGTPRKPVLDELKAGRDVLLEIDVQGAFQVKHQYPQAVLIFIEPPDESVLKSRLESRARDSHDDMMRRFREAKREIGMAKGSRAFEYTVINDELDRAVDEIAKIIKLKRSTGI